VAREERKVCGLRFATPCERPSCIPIGRPRGVKALGIRYERTVAEALQRTYGTVPVKYGQWFEFHDANGRGYAQVDLLLHIANMDHYVVGECKLTDTEEAWRKLREFYLPIVKMATQRPCVGFVVCKNLTRASDPRSVCDSFRTTLLKCLNGGSPVWHFLGRGPP
jgi:hypothetical protein